MKSRKIIFPILVFLCLIRYAIGKWTTMSSHFCWQYKRKGFNWAASQATPGCFIWLAVLNRSADSELILHRTVPTMDDSYYLSLTSQLVSCCPYILWDTLSFDETQKLSDGGIKLFSHKSSRRVSKTLNESNSCQVLYFLSIHNSNVCFRVLQTLMG